MNPGTLDRKIQIQRSTAATGRFGADSESWTLWKTRMARRIEKPGSERSDNARERTAGSITFRIRYTPGIETTDRLVDIADNGLAYDIEDYTGDPRQGWMEIHCTRHRTPANTAQTLP